MCHPGPAPAPRGIPGGLAGFRALPHGEIGGVTLPGPLGLPFGPSHPAADRTGTRSRPARGPRNRRPPPRRRPAGVDQLADHRQDLRDVPGGAGLHGGRQAAQRGVGPGEGALVGRGPVPPLPAGIVGLRQDLVIDVRDVPDVHHLVPAVLQPASQHVVDHSGPPQVADVRRGLDGGAAVVQPDPSGPQRLERPHRTRRVSYRCRVTGASYESPPNPSGNGPSQRARILVAANA